MSTHPHKSTTHEEMFFHIHEPLHGYRGATVFFRKDANTGVWFGSAAFCSMKDMFNRRIGRCQARRRFFLQDGGLISKSDNNRPKYDEAVDIANREAQLIGRLARI